MSSKQNTQKEVDAWRLKRYQECSDASKHQMYLSVVALGYGDQGPHEGHKKSSQKFAAKANFLDTHTFKTIAEGEAALEKIN